MLLVSPVCAAASVALPVSSLAGAGDEAVPTTGVAGWAVDLMERLGVVGAGSAIALENLFPPLPSELILPLAGFTASRGEFGLLAVIAATTLGSVVGAVVLYAVGALIGRDRLRVLVDRLPLVKLADVDKAEAWFARHGTKAVLLGRMVPIVRSLISVPAGLERMRLTTFVALTAAGSLVWNSIFVVAGYQLGERWEDVTPYAEVAQRVVLVVAVLLLAVWLVRLVRRRRDVRA